MTEEKVIVIKGADAIAEFATNGPNGFAQYVTKYSTGNGHELHRAALPFLDLYEGYCSCGQWYAYTTLYRCFTQEAMIEAVIAAHAEHASLIEEERS
jgi:hypothetical protein